ncbi:MAG: hypothetical protein ABSE59_00155 [Opitutaceae bacterium]|jgi:hypothetical protein
MPETGHNDDWTCGGWEEAEMNTLRHGATLSLYQKLLKIEELEEIFLHMQRTRLNYQPCPEGAAPQAAETPPPDPGAH